MDDLSFGSTYGGWMVRSSWYHCTVKVLVINGTLIKSVSSRLVKDTAPRPAPPEVTSPQEIDPTSDVLTGLCVKS